MLIQVDSSVGGKTGVNHPLGKNMIGAFYQPQCVLIDTDTLNTLPDRELASGIAEVVKYGLIRDAEFFEWQEQNIQSLLARYHCSFHFFSCYHDCFCLTVFFFLLRSTASVSCEFCLFKIPFNDHSRIMVIQSKFD